MVDNGRMEERSRVQSEANARQFKDRLDKPLRGAVLCCTSIPPEQRSRYAEIATQMGAEHKLDLTSDVTHLVVGESNTAKYKYVAREREDVKVLKPEWIEAVRLAWLTAEMFDLAAIEKAYKFPPLTGLAVCVTGFEDLAFRSHLQDTIVALGGEYRGDLTKTVTHLIANLPQGKKYQYAEQWKIKVVSLKWLKDTMDRGMVLDESLYHPTLPTNEQGKGAWVKAPDLSLLGKRARDEPAAADVPRKLRRTASARLGGQSEDLWGDIMGGGFETGLEPQNQLKTSKSLPLMKPVVHELTSFALETAEKRPGDGDQSLRNQRSDLETQNERSGFFNGMIFYIHGFNARKTAILEVCVSTNGGIFVDTLDALSTSVSERQCSPIVIISHDHPRAEMPSVDGIEPTPDVVTEMWVEKCISAGTRVSPDEYPFGRPVQQFPIPGFERLVINSTGFEVVQLLHTSKIVNLLGGKYDETLKPDVSVLVCASKSFNRNKSLHARLWRMPVVSSDWLWSCMERGQLQSFDAYQVLPNKWELEEMAKHQEHNVGDSSKKEADPKRTERSGKNEYARYEEHSDSAKEGVHLQSRQIEAAQPRAPSGYLIDSDRHLHNSATIKPMPDPDEDEGLRLREISPNSPPKVREESPKRGKKSLFRTLDGQGSVPGTDNSASGPPSAPQPTSTGKTDYIPPQADTINGAIQELLGLKSRTKSNVPSRTNSPIKKTLLGRALSNPSNSSGGPLTTRPSRAGSVDSVNTDGVGSVIALDGSSPGRPPNSVRTQSMGFTGRASAREAVHAEPSIELGDRGLYEDEFTGEEPAPQMTQLGYGEHADAIRLREQLAEKRRKRSKQGQETTETIVQERKIRDDDVLLEGGWGGGRRTRQKDRAPKGVEDF